MRKELIEPSAKALKNFVDMEHVTRGINNQLSKSGKYISAFTSGVGNVFNLLGNKMGQFLKDSVELADDLNSVDGMVELTFRRRVVDDEKSISLDNKGTPIYDDEYIKSIQEWSKGTLKQYGITSSQAKKYSSEIGQMLKGTGIEIDKVAEMSKELIGRSGDISSFYGLDKEVAFKKIKRAMEGQRDAVNDLGFNMTEANLEAFALEKGLKKQWKQMSESEQMTMRYNFILEKTSDTEGNFADSMNIMSNQMIVAKGYVEEIGRVVGQFFIPIAIEGLKKINEWLEKLNKYVHENEEGFKRLGEFAAEAVNSVAGVIDSIIANWEMIQSIICQVVVLIGVITTAIFFLKFFNFIIAALNLGPFGFVIAWMIAIVASSEAVYQIWNKLCEMGRKLMEVFKGTSEETKEINVKTNVDEIPDIQDSYGVKQLQGMGMKFDVNGGMNIEEIIPEDQKEFLESNVKQGKEYKGIGKIDTDFRKRYGTMGSKGDTSAASASYMKMDSKLVDELKEGNMKNESLLTLSSESLKEIQNSASEQVKLTEEANARMRAKEGNDKKIELHFHGDVYGIEGFKERVAQAIVQMHNTNGPNVATA